MKWSSSLVRCYSMNGSRLYTFLPESRPGLRESETAPPQNQHTGFEEEYKKNEFDCNNVKLVEKDLEIIPLLCI